MVDILDLYPERITPEPNTGCWLWESNSSRYPGIRVEGVYWNVHRLSWSLSNGEIPTNMNVCHSCDVVICVNPSHLFLGSQSENIADCVKKGRHARGEKISNKLTENMVLQIREATTPYTQIAADFGISPAMVCLIKKRVNWTHV